ncbi:hypothetical protein [Streptomyces sp. NPDC005017]|uniref:hypothetical protein n=1 Tax=Streptomyces sp. NPDC005017 TaxID=3364706 RepID=UPI003696C369
MSTPDPWLTQPDTNITTAVHRTMHAIGALAEALGDGTHTLHIASERTDDTFVRAQADPCTGPRPANLAILDTQAFNTLPALLVFALEGSTIRSTVLVATSAAEPRPRARARARARARTIRDRWLHPMNTDALAQALNPCPGHSPAVQRDIYPTPALEALSDTGEAPRDRPPHRHRRQPPYPHHPRTRQHPHPQYQEHRPWFC